ncbi:MAG: LPS export ABC transporter periplasmic protein LptC [Bacteroidota bacterium]
MNLIFKKKWLLLLIVILLALIAYFLLSSLFYAVSKKQEVLVGEGKLQVNSDEFTGLILKIPGAEKNGHWELNIARLESKEALGLLTEINGEYFLDKQPIYYISAESGTIWWKTRVLQITGLVNLKTNDGKVLKAEKVSWDPNARRITAEKEVLLESPDLTISTDKFDGDLNLEQAKMSGMTKAFYRR